VCSWPTTSRPRRLPSRWIAVRRYDLSRRNALPWLYGIATNLLRQHRRAELRQYRALARTGVDPVLVEGHADVVSGAK